MACDCALEEVQGKLKRIDVGRHLAAAEGCYSVVQWLLTEGKCGPNPIDRFNRTPLEVQLLGQHDLLSTSMLKAT